MRYTGQVVIAALLIVVHVIVCLFLIIVVLLQSGKAADLAGAFGGMGSRRLLVPGLGDVAFQSDDDLGYSLHAHVDFALHFGDSQRRRCRVHRFCSATAARVGSCRACQTSARAATAEEVVKTTRPSIAEVAELADALA